MWRRLSVQWESSGWADCVLQPLGTVKVRTHCDLCPTWLCRAKFWSEDLPWLAAPRGNQPSNLSATMQQLVTESLLGLNMMLGSGERSCAQQTKQTRPYLVKLSLSSSSVRHGGRGERWTDSPQHLEELRCRLVHLKVSEFATTENIKYILKGQGKLSIYYSLIASERPRGCLSVKTWNRARQLEGRMEGLREPRARKERRWEWKIHQNFRDKPEKAYGFCATLTKLGQSFKCRGTRRTEIREGICSDKILKDLHVEEDKIFYSNGQCKINS